ncbi:MAG: SpoIIE family protein phosphatase [Crocinitomicaceae bacterium]|nr:SpoIIE family protein phosphatase [Crocinitomicaceae bacterium]
MRFKVYYSIPLLLVACSSPEPAEIEEKLYSERPVVPTHADSIQTQTAFDFIPSDTFDFTELPRTDFVEERNPLSTVNTFDATDTVHQVYLQLQKIPVAKKSPVKPEPFIASVTHPKPAKAGEFRRTGNSKENIQYLDAEQGLPASNISSILEDQFGFMWFASPAGLTRYDGNYFYHYTEENGLPDNFVSEIYLDKKQNMWISTRSGLVRFDGERFEIYTEETGLTSNNPASFCEDDNGNLWFTGNGITKYDYQNFYHYSAEDGLRMDNVLELGVDSLNRIFIGYYGDTPDFFANDTLYRLQEDIHRGFEKFGSNIQTATFRDADKNLWIGNYNGGVVNVKSNNTTICYKPKSGLPMLSFGSIMQDSQGYMWCSSNEGGVMKLEGDKFISYTTKQGLNINYAQTIFEDSKGNIWVGTLGGGVNKIIPNSFRSYDETDGMSTKSVNSISMQEDGTMIFGTWAHGIWMFDGKYWNHPTKFIQGLIVYDTETDYLGNTIVGAHMHGTYYLAPSEKDTAFFDHGFNFNNIPDFKSYGVRKIIRDENDDIWLFDDLKGIYVLALNDTKTAYEKVYRYTTASGLNSDKLRYALKDSKNRFWLVDQQNGLSCIDHGKITHYTEKDGLLSNNSVTLYEDYQQQLIIGTDKGLCIFDGDKFKSITVEDGLSNSLVRSIVEDDQHRLWLGTNRGLNLLQPDSSKSIGYAITVYESKDGLKSMEFMPHCAQMDKQNNIWWSTRRGLVKLNLDSFDAKQELPVVQITQLDLMNQLVDFQGLADSISQHTKYYVADSSLNLSEVKFDSLVPYFNYPKTVTLPYYINTLTFRYASSVALPTHQIKYRTRLVGFDESWSAESFDSEAKFANLPAGEYCFEVQAKMQNNPWGEITSYSFTIHPPFWKTWWFRALVFVVVLLFIYLIFRWRNRALIIRQLQLEETVAERTQEIQEQKTLIEEKQVEILDSINYAQRIQRALLAGDDLLKRNLRDYFVFFQPKDIVSGDFYWCSEVATKNFILLTADSTGHGVPGAIMSMLNIASVEKAVESEKLTSPAAILNFTRKKIIETLAKDGSADGGKDGMDCSLISFDFEKMELTYSAANNGIWILREGALLEFAPDKMPVGKHIHDQTPFSEQTIPIFKDDIVYSFTDGMADQFGGPKGKKFKYKSLKELLVEISSQPMIQQKARLEKTLQDWKGDLEQVDDVCVIGVRV